MLETFHKEVFKRYGEIFHMHRTDEFSFVNDGEAITDCLHIRENMCIEEERFSFFLELDHEILDHFSTNRIKSTHWFIEKYEFWIMEDGLRESNTLKHSL